MARLGAICVGGRYTGFSVWLMRLGVRVAHGRPYHPQTQGKDERFHRTLQGSEVLTGCPYADLIECQRAFDRWRHVYNHQRPHQALDMATPGRALSREILARSPRCCRRSNTAPTTSSARPTTMAISVSKAAGFVLASHSGAPADRVARDHPGRRLRASISASSRSRRSTLTAMAASACGLVDIATAMPTSPQAQHQKSKTRSTIEVA